MNYKENKEIMDLIKHITEIDKQIKNPDENLRNVIKDVQGTIPNESLEYETLAVSIHGGKLTTLNNIDINVLYNKLPDYKILCKTVLFNKCGKELYNHICREEMIK